MNEGSQKWTVVSEQSGPLGDRKRLGEGHEALEFDRLEAAVNVIDKAVRSRNECGTIKCIVHTGWGERCHFKRWLDAWKSRTSFAPDVVHSSDLGGSGEVTFQQIHGAGCFMRSYQLLSWSKNFHLLWNVTNVSIKSSTENPVPVQSSPSFHVKFLWDKFVYPPPRSPALLKCALLRLRTNVL
jgi:hypothetical protein